MSRQEWLTERTRKIKALEQRRAYLTTLGTSSLTDLRELAMVNSDIVMTKRIINNINSGQPTHGEELEQEHSYSNMLAGRK